MAVPKHKISKSRGGQRRAHTALPLPSLAVCPNCQEPRLPHHVCSACGWHRGRVVIEVDDI